MRGHASRLVWLGMALGCLCIPATALRAQDDSDAEELQAAHRQAQALTREGKLPEAVEQLKRAVALAPRVFGRDDPSTAALMHNLARLYLQTRQYPQAESLLLRSLEIAEDKRGEDHPDVAAVLGSLAELYQARGEYTRAEPLLRRTLRIREEKLGKDHALVAHTLNELGLLYCRTDHPQKGEPLLRRCLAIKEKELGPDDPEVATILSNLGVACLSVGKPAEAERLLQRALEIREQKLGKDDVGVAETLSHLADLYKSTQRLLAAEPLYRRCLGILQDRLGPDHPDVASILASLGILYLHLGQHARAEPLLLRCLRLHERRLGKDHPDVAYVLSHLAALYCDRGEYTRAEALCQRALQIEQARLPKDHPHTAHTLETLASINQNVGQYSRAEALYQRSLDIQEAIHGENSPRVARTLESLGSVYEHRGPYSRAEALYRRDLRIVEEAMGSDHIETARVLGHLAGAYRLLHQYDRAEPLYQRCLKIRQDRLGRDHPDVATTLNNLALLYTDTGRAEQAEPLYRRAISIKRDRWGPDHPDVAGSLSNLALLYAAQGKWTDAAEALDGERRARRNHVAHVLPGLSEAEQLVFLKEDESVHVHGALSLGLRRPGDSRIAEQSAAWLLNGKAQAQEALAERTLLARDRGDAELSSLVQQLQAVRAQLAQLTLSTPRPGEEDQHYRQQQECRRKEQELSKRLGQAGGAAHVQHWVELAQVRQALPADSVLVEFARFAIRIFTMKDDEHVWQPAHYAAWVIPPAGKGTVCVVDLGDADRIDEAVARARKALDEAPRLLREAGSEAAEKEARHALDTLAALVVRPLRPHIDGSPRWVLCPDGALWLAPWAALPLDEKTYAVERHTIRLVVSGRHVLTQASVATHETTAPAVFADPDFDTAPGGTATRLAGQTCPGSIGERRVKFEFLEGGKVNIYDAGDGEKMGEGSWEVSGEDITLRTRISHFTGRIEAGRAAGERRKQEDDGQVRRDPWQFRLPPDAVAENSSRSGASLKLPKVRSLPGTAAEAEAVAEHLQKLCGAAPRVQTGTAATTAAFLGLRRPQVLVLATHGFFLPDQRPNFWDRDQTSRGQTPHFLAGVEDPLLRCGLLLAGCNRGSDRDTGVLTGREVLLTDLRGTQLVVLSACETGLGDVRNGEGVAGLRQAFLLAGAQSVLASLWKVPDDDTALLMASYFNRLARGEGRAEALRQAQLQRIQQRRDKFGAAHPCFWAAFSLTGDAGPLRKDD